MIATERVNKALVGVAGVHFVAAELSRLGYVATITLRNTRGIDILTSSARSSRSVGIQVKTTRGKKWVLNKTAETYQARTLFYVFVKLNAPDQLPDYHVVPSRTVARVVAKNHREWLAQPNRAGGAHRDNSMRNFRVDTDKFLGRWDLLGLGGETAS